MSADRVQPQRILFAAVAASAALLLASCSSAGSSATGAGAPTATGSSGATGQATSSAGTAAATAIDQTLNQYSGQAPIGLTPLEAKPAAGEKVIHLSNSASPEDALVAQGFLAAAKVLGWSASTISYAGDPASVASAFQQAISDKPDAIEVDAESPGTIATSLKAAAAAGIPVFEEATPVSPTGMSAGGLTGVEFGSKYIEAEALIGADWILKDSGGKADVLVVTSPALEVLTLQANDFVADMQKACPSCHTTVINVQLTGIGATIPATVVSALESNPSYKYAYFPYGDVSIGVSAALKVANISAKLVTSAADASQYANLKSGGTAMAEVTTPAVQGWIQIDAMARYFETHKPVDDDIAPLKIWDSANDSAATLPTSPTDYQSQFEALWHVG